MRLPQSATSLHKPWRRLDSFRRELGSKSLTLIIIIASITALAAVSYVVASFVKARRQRHKGGRKQKTRWAGCWSLFRALGRRGKRQRRYEQASGGNFDETSCAHQLETTTAASAEHRHVRQASRQTQNGSLVDRNTSVRSVMTLPAYRAIAAHNEQVIGIAGDRGGVDVIVDLPTAEEQESLREAEMEAIYQIRLARRQRHGSPQRGNDNVSSEAPSQPRRASNTNMINELRRDVNRIQEQRQRSVSSVSYADLGVARHDGTRLRTNSNESERMGLLSGAASFTVSTLHEQSHHGRERSASSLTSIDSDLHTVHSASRVGPQSTAPRLSAVEIDASCSELTEVGTEVVDSLPPPQYENESLGNFETERAVSTSQQPPPKYTTHEQTVLLDAERMTLSDSVVSNNSETEADPTGEAFPRLPSLRFPSLPIIVVEPGELPTQSC